MMDGQKALRSTGTFLLRIKTDTPMGER